MAINISAPTTVAKLGGLRVWAERGLIRSVQEKTGERRDMSIRDAIERTIAINDMLKISPRHERNYAYIDNWENHMRFVEDMIKVIQEAKEQGDPNDESVVKDRLRRMKVTIPMFTM